MSAQTFGHEDGLPRVPVPTLERSAELFLDWAAPLLTAAERAETEQAVAQLLDPEGEARRLHQALLAYDARPDGASWLDEFWRDRYLGRRDRIALNANFFFLLNDTGQDQATRAASLVTAALAVKRELDEQRVPVATRRGAPLSMEQYKFLFSATRIPGERRDTARTPYDPSGWPGPSPARHIVVFHRGTPLRLDVIGPDGAPHTAAEIGTAVQAVLDRSPSGPGPGLGRLTTLARAEWAATREAVRANSPVNAAALEEIESALLCLCLDEQAPSDPHAGGELLLAGDGTNRWYDKALSLIVFANGAAGLNGEHCRLDGTTIVALIDAMAARTVGEHEAVSGAREQGVPVPEEIPVALSQDLQAKADEAGTDFAAYAGSAATGTLHLDIGAEAIKTAGSSPDALVQMAIQVAHYRTKGQVGATYESVAMRGYRHGRTEAMRVVTPESVALVETMAHPQSTAAQRCTALRAALDAHVRRSRECQVGDAPEQHLWELQLLRCRQGTDGPEPALYTSPGWRILRDDYLSTSAVPSPNVQLFGFGATAPQCIGVGYAVQAERFDAFLCTGRASAAELEAFTDHLATAIPELVALLQDA